MKNVCGPSSQSLKYGFDQACLYAFAQQKWHDNTSKHVIRRDYVSLSEVDSCLTICKDAHQDKETQEVTITPRAPLNEITEPIMLFC